MVLRSWLDSRIRGNDGHLRHSRAGGNPWCCDRGWIPAFAGMTVILVIPAQAGTQGVAIVAGFPHSRE